MENNEKLDGVEIKVRFPTDTTHQMVQYPLKPFWLGNLRSTKQTVVAVFLDRGDQGDLEVTLNPAQIKHALDSVARQEVPVFDTLRKPENLISDQAF